MTFMSSEAAWNITRDRDRHSCEYEMCTYDNRYVQDTHAQQ